jgi:hypothetical protein
VWSESLSSARPLSARTLWASTWRAATTGKDYTGGDVKTKFMNGSIIQVAKRVRNLP